MSYIRTPEIRERNRLNASGPCPAGCDCGKHRSGNSGNHSKPCPPGCGCGKHHRTARHNLRIGMSLMKPKRWRYYGSRNCPGCGMFMQVEETRLVCVNVNCRLGESWMLI